MCFILHFQLETSFPKILYTCTHHLDTETERYKILCKYETLRKRKRKRLKKSFKTFEKEEEKEVEEKLKELEEEEEEERKRLKQN